jgi:Protein of unknown function (DUF2752)
MTVSLARSRTESQFTREVFLWRAGTAGSILAFLAILPLPLNAQVPLCGVFWLTGRPCPFCGLTRALACLLKGEMEVALSLHPLSPLALAALLTIFIGGSLRLAWPYAPFLAVPKEASRFLRVGSLLIFLVYGVWRFCLGEHT